MQIERTSKVILFFRAFICLLQPLKTVSVLLPPLLGLPVLNPRRLLAFRRANLLVKVDWMALVGLRVGGYGEHGAEGLGKDFEVSFLKSLARPRPSVKSKLKNHLTLEDLVFKEFFCE